MVSDSEMVRVEATDSGLQTAQEDILSANVKKSKDNKSLNRKDRRVVRTEKKIHKVFLELLEEHSYADITVGMILERAKINRSTFYKHYINKHDLASEVMANCQESIISSLLGEERLSIGNLGFFKSLQSTLSKNRELLKLVFRLNGEELDVRKSFHDSFYRSIKKHYEGRLYSSNDDELDLGAYVSADILISVLMYYLEKGEEVHPDNIIRVIVNMYGLRSYYTPE